MQTSVDAMEIAVPGLLADDTMSKDAISSLSEEETAEIPFGVMVGQGADDDGAVLLGAVTDFLRGVSVFGQYYSKPTELGEVGLMPGTRFDCLLKGRIYVLVEGDVTPTHGVHVRAVADEMMGEVAGAFRGTGDGSDTIDCSTFAKWRTSASDGELAVLEIDMTNSSSPDADS